MAEETHAEVMQRLRARAAALGIGPATRAARVKKAIAAQTQKPRTAFNPASNPASTPTRQHGKPPRAVRCVDTGEVWPSIVACAMANGGTQNGMSAAFDRAKKGEGVAWYKGRRFVLVADGEEDR